MKLAILTFLFGFCVACDAHAESELGVLTDRSDSIAITHTLYAEEFILSRNHPVSEALQITFLGIADDGYASIRLASGVIIRAKKGESFSCTEFGRSGLVYVGSSKNKLGIRLRRYTCETTETR